MHFPAPQVHLKQRTPTAPPSTSTALLSTTTFTNPCLTIKTEVHLSAPEKCTPGWVRYAAPSTSALNLTRGGHLSIKIPSYQYRNSHYEDKTVSWPSYLYTIPRNTIFVLRWGPGFNGLGKDNCKTRRETFWDLVWLILEVWRYICYFHHPVIHTGYVTVWDGHDQPGVVLVIKRTPWLQSTANKHCCNQTNNLNLWWMQAVNRQICRLFTG